MSTAAAHRARSRAAARALRRAAARRRRVLGATVLAALALAGPPAIVLFTAFEEPAGAVRFRPSAVALADIPPGYLALYERAAVRFGVDWAVLAGIGKIECNHGRDREAGCVPGTVNSAGATGPMQFLAPTWRTGAALGTVPAPGPPTASVQDGFATDGDGDGIADVSSPADAIAAAARYLRANGAPGDYRRAVFAYNHAQWYVALVLRRAAAYRG